MSPRPEQLGHLVCTIEAVHRETDIDPIRKNEAIDRFASMAAEILKPIPQKAFVNGRGRPELVAFAFDQIEGEPFCVNPVIRCMNGQGQNEHYLSAGEILVKLNIDKADGATSEQVFMMEVGEKAITYIRGKIDDIGLDMEIMGSRYFELDNPIALTEKDSKEVEQELKKQMEDLTAQGDCREWIVVFGEMEEGLLRGSSD